MVRTCAVESYGRIGAEFLESLALLDYKAHQEDLAKKQPTTRWYGSWLDHLSCGIARGVARSIADALALAIAEA